MAVGVDDPRLRLGCWLNASRHFDSASVVKVTILGALLRKALDQRRFLTGTEAALARAMITRSDNDAASDLWAELGHGYLRHFLNLAEITQTSSRTAMRSSAMSAIQCPGTTWSCSADADYSPRSWLIHRTRIARGTATAHTAWARRAMAHPQVTKALASGEVVSESHARTICQWSDKIPERRRPAADAILIAAAKAGAALEDLAQLAAEIYVRSLPGSR